MTLRAVTVLLVTILGLTLTPGPARAAAPTTVCRIGDKRLTELSGLAATPTGYTVVNDGSDDPDARKIFYLSPLCKVTRTVGYPSRPRDTEDLGVAPDGTLWIADIGDNGEDRDSIGLWRLSPGDKKPELFRLKYPDGPHNAEALLLTSTGTPVLVTKSVMSAGIYVPAGPLRSGKTTSLRAAGTVTIPVTTTRNPFSFAGRLVVTGGAVSPDGKHATLRTYADAFEYDVASNDLIAALTSGRPTEIPLPDEPQGESVAYTPDGTALLTVSETSDQPKGTKANILRYALPGRAPVTTPPPPPSSSPAARPAIAPSTRAVADHDSRVPAGALLTGGVLTLAAAALLAVLIARRRTRS